LGLLERFPDIDDYEPEDGAYAVDRDWLMTLDLDDESIPKAFRDQARRMREQDKALE
jgi:hypothetical protein